MRRWCALMALSTLLSGCAKYQYVTVSGNMPSNEQKEFVHENDSLILKYNFNGYGCPVKISVHNKLDMPLFIDWKRSSLIVNDLSQPYSGNNAVIRAHGSGTTFNWGPSSSTHSMTLEGTLTTDEATGFIPPHAGLQREVLSASDGYKKLKGRRSNSITISAGDSFTSARLYKFEEESSPIKFRSYLTLSTYPDFQTTIIFDDTFWVNEIVQTRVNPKFYYEDSYSGNQYHAAKLTGAGTGAALVGLAALALLIGSN